MSEEKNLHRAVFYEAYGEPATNLKLDRIPIPQPKQKQVQIQVRAAAINPVDWKGSRGYLQQMIPVTFPHTMGFDVAGVVSAVGADVTDFKVGMSGFILIVFRAWQMFCS